MSDDINVIVYRHNVLNLKLYGNNEQVTAIVVLTIIVKRALTIIIIVIIKIVFQSLIYKSDFEIL
jgi:hypothetical protein